MNGQIMKGIVAAFASLLVVACAGCGGGGGGGSDAPKAAPVVKKVITIVAQGDSTMYGWTGGDSKSPNNPPAVIATTLGVPVVDDSVPGTAVYDDLASNPTYYKASFGSRIAPGQIVLENFGINDVKLYDVNEFGNQLRQWVMQIRAAGKTPIIEQPNPVCRQFVDDASGKVAANAAMARQVAQDMGVLLVDQFDYVSSMPNWQAQMRDCVHPNDALYKLKAEYTASKIRSLITSMQ